ncbi:MAG: hypothetical protein ACTHNS_11005 [Marmoricola sp.]
MSPPDGGSPHDRDPDRDARNARAEDDAWRDIVAHYGERADLPEAPPDPAPPAGRWYAAPSEHAVVPEEGRRPDPAPDEERYLPPPVPPAPLPRGPRALAWAGLFGSPVVMLVFLVVGWTIPQWLGVLLFMAFVGGFGYLVATMRKHDDSDPWDDGAVV